MLEQKPIGAPTSAAAVANYFLAKGWDEKGPLWPIRPSHHARPSAEESVSDSKSLGRWS
jgi:membrane-bound lytic murein transglycosylase B